MKKLKKVIDERQELEMLKAERMAFRVMWGILLLSIVVQSYIMNVDIREYGWEMVAFLGGNIVALIALIRKGNWDYYSKPTPKYCLLYSLAASVIFTIIFVAGKLYQNEYFKENIPVLAGIAAFFFVIIFVLCFVALIITSSYAKNKQDKLAQQLEESDGDDE